MEIVILLILVGEDRETEPVELKGYSQDLKHLFSIFDKHFVVAFVLKFV